MKIHLLEPYRSAFIARCVHDNLIESVPPNIALESPGMKKCGTTNLMNEALQLSVLSSSISMVWTEVGSVAKEHGLPYMKMSGLQNMGVIDLISKYPPEIESIVKDKWKHISNLNDLWVFEKEAIDTYSPIILSQLEKRGKPVNWILYRLLRAVRLGEEKAIPTILNAVPPHLNQEAKLILSIEPRIAYEFEMSIIFTLQELQLTELTAFKNGYKIAGASFEKTNSEQQQIDKSLKIYGLVIEELAGVNISFPVPESISDVMRLRNKSEIVDFRNFLNPFLNSVLSADEKSFLILRKEIQNCVKAFKRYPQTQRLAKWTTYASIGVGVLEAFYGLVGPSIGMGILSVGLDDLAKKWEKSSTWLYLANSGD